MIKSKSVPKLRCKCIRITDKARGEVVATYYVLGGQLYGFIDGGLQSYGTLEFMKWFGGYAGTIQGIRRLYGKGYKVQVFMYDQSKLDLSHIYG